MNFFDIFQSGLCCAVQEIVLAFSSLILGKEEELDKILICILNFAALLQERNRELPSEKDEHMKKRKREEEKGG